MKRSTIILLMFFALASVFSAESIAANKPIGKYTQTKYHKRHNSVDWHHCDFNLQATIPGDFSKINAQWHLTIEIDQDLLGPVVLLDGDIDEIGVFKATKTGAKISFNKGEHNYSGSLTASNKKLILNLGAKTSRDDAIGGNYLLPIDEDIAIWDWNTMKQKAAPPFTGIANATLVLTDETGETQSLKNYTVNYKGSNRYSEKVLPWQKITGSLFELLP